MFVCFCRSSRQFWSTSNPHQLVQYTLTIHAPPHADDDDVIYSLNSQQQQLLDDNPWLCVQSTVEESGSVPAHPLRNLLTPTQTPATNALLREAHDFPVTDKLRTFRIPRRTAVKRPTLKDLPPPPPPPQDTPCLQRYLAGLPTAQEEVCFKLTCSDGKEWTGYHLNGECLLCISELKIYLVFKFSEVWGKVISAFQETRDRLGRCLPYLSLVSSTPSLFSALIVLSLYVLRVWEENLCLLH